MTNNDTSEGSEDTELSDEESGDSEREIDVKEYITRIKWCLRRCKILEARFKLLKQYYYKLRVNVNETKMKQLLNSDSALFKDLMKTRKEAMETECLKAAECMQNTKECIAVLSSTEKTKAENTKSCSIEQMFGIFRVHLLGRLKTLEDEYVGALVKQRLWVSCQDDKKKHAISDALNGDDDDLPRGSSFPKIGEPRHRSIRKNEPRIVYGLSEKRLAEELGKIRKVVFTQGYRKLHYSYEYEKIFGTC
ncbi:hypothetical protein M514_05458 [Trichuris suis]|uniref:Uncharacterized protein n=1 Tax=Trichuris suis TaxID=68888 RepID=A0A085M957_9BILA|nr:hypothetical protein M513_05458 [Trichuris suis]KFD72472.1 hypothetical protein M514_05458 [Trichuris suis]